MALVSAAPAPSGIGARLLGLHWGLIVLIVGVLAVGVGLLYSAGGGSLEPWAQRQGQRAAVALVGMIVAALIPLKFWLRLAYVAFAVGVALLVATDLFGRVGKGAERWINLGFFNLQPSEIVKVALVMALARYFHRADFADIGKIRKLLIPAALIAVPFVMVLRQPDLGTAMLLALIGLAMFFAAGVRFWKFGVGAALAAAAAPFAYARLHDYQKQRIITFLDPERDPLGAGYHIIQSKIALGSGGLTGKGWLQATQIRLNFLPEFHTDFILSVLAEEFGLVGGLALLALYALIIGTTLAIALRSRSTFGRLVAFGMATMLFLHVAINMGMVMGLLPVVGVPLPLVSFGGTSMLSLMFGFGLVLSAHLSREEKIGRFDLDD
jgi:rod shape determining protein RodA